MVQGLHCRSTPTSLRHLYHPYWQCREIPQLRPIDQICTMANPHSSAFVDIDGDCLPGEKRNALNRSLIPNVSLDLVLHCSRSKTVSFIQIWLNRGDAGYILARSYDLPSGSGPISFADTSKSKSLEVCETNTLSLGRS